MRAYDDAVTAIKAAASCPLAAPSGLGEDRLRRLAGPGGSVVPGVRQSRDAGKAVGIVLHRLLEGWNGRDAERLTETLATLCEQTSRETRTDLAILGREAGEILAAFLASDLAARFPRLERLGAEVPVLMRQEATNRAFRGSIDLLYKDADGRVVVADYKTDRETDPSELHRHYAAQLGIYADAVRQALDLDQRPRRELWLLRSGRVLPLDDEAGPTGSDKDPEQLALW